MDYQDSDLALTLPANNSTFDLTHFTRSFTDIQNYINGTRTKIGSIDNSITTLNNKTQNLNSSGQIDWSYILNKSHNHSAGDIDSGTLSIERGGTGANTTTGSSGAVSKLFPVNVSTTANHLLGITNAYNTNGYIPKDKVLPWLELSFIKKPRITGFGWGGNGYQGGDTNNAATGIEFVDWQKPSNFYNLGFIAVFDTPIRVNGSTYWRISTEGGSVYTGLNLDGSWISADTILNGIYFFYGPRSCYSLGYLFNNTTNIRKNLFPTVSSTTSPTYILGITNNFVDGIHIPISGVPSLIFNQAQLDAINSGITSTKLKYIDQVINKTVEHKYTWTSSHEAGSIATTFTVTETPFTIASIKSMSVSSQYGGLGTCTYSNFSVSNKNTVTVKISWNGGGGGDTLINTAIFVFNLTID